MSTTDPPKPESRHLPPQALCVLVADDIASSRDALAGLVAAMGHRYVLAASGAETLAQVAREKPDIVLLDLLMPDMNGFEVTRLLREREGARWLPVIVTSGLQGEEHFVHALSQGADDYLARPVSPALLQAKLRHYQRVLALQSRGNLLAQRQRAIHDHIADAVITLDDHGRVHEANLAAERLFGTDGTPLPGRSCVEVLGLSLTSLLQSTELQHAVAGQDARVLAVSIGSWGVDGQNFHTVALHDLSEHRRVERMKDEFLATVSHELRTPLTSVLGALGLLAAGAGGVLPGPAAELASVARRNGERLSRLIDDVLDLTKLEGSRMTLQLRTLALDELLAEALEANRGYAQRGDIRLVLECRAEQARVNADADRLLQVMANLLSNAIKHSPPHSEVRVLLYGVPQGWRIDVMDQGPGIAPGFREQLFGKFAQADGSDRRALGGTGLGLYISRLLVERMGGSISAQSEHGQGSTFSVVLPARPAQGSAWLLCIDRDRQRLERTCDWLSGRGTVHGVPDLAAAQELLKRLGPPQALVADPQTQESAERFCQSLRTLAPTDSILLIGDSIDSAFATTQGLAWMPGAGAGREQLLTALDGLEQKVGHG